jgi:hypothetical protein
MLVPDSTVRLTAIKSIHPRNVIERRLNPIFEGLRRIGKKNIDAGNEVGLTEVPDPYRATLIKTLQALGIISSSLPS